MNQNPIKTDLLIIGAGLGGCVTALKAADQGLKVVLITLKTSPDDCNTGRAQGGIIYKGINDSPETLIQDIWNAGCQRGYIPAIRQLVYDGPAMIEEMFFDRLKIPFDRTSSGNIHLTAEGGHSTPRIIHCADSTGKTIHEHTMDAVFKHPAIQVYSNCTAIDLLTSGHSSTDAQDKYKPQTCFGAYIFDNQTGKVFPIVAKDTVLATGGVSGLYLHSTNTEYARGDGIAMARRAGARIINMQYIQFHPTGLYHPTYPRFLLSEALRGEGAILLNHQGEEFMKKYHTLNNLAPRDIVARAIYDEMIQHKKQFVFLDISHKKSSWISKRFPLISRICKEYGYDLSEGPVPVVPVAHYSCGGILVDLNADTDIHHLKAVGEVSCTGVHGANRLASTSLLECLVWGMHCADSILKQKQKTFSHPKILPWQYEHEPRDLSLIHQDWLTLRNTMWNYVGPVRSVRRLERANNILSNLKQEVENFYDKAKLSDELIGLRNGIEAALTVLHEAIYDKNSTGCHFYEKS